MSDFAPDGFCSQMKLINSYWVPTANISAFYGFCTPLQDNAGGHTFAHLTAEATNTRIQSYTIDTAMFADARNEPTALYVSDGSLSGPIYRSQNSKLQVEIYTYHAGQLGVSSVYRPTQTFEIKNANHSTNSLAKFWHVFNITPDVAGSVAIPGSAKWRIKTVQSVRSDQCDVEHSIYESVTCPTP
jgi:hypothetical protein